MRVRMRALISSSNGFDETKQLLRLRIIEITLRMFAEGIERGEEIFTARNKSAPGETTIHSIDFYS